MADRPTPGGPGLTTSPPSDRRRHAGRRLLPLGAAGIAAVLGVVLAIVVTPTGGGDGHAGRQETGTSSSVPGSGLRLAFDARFGGTTLDRSVWGTCYPWAESPSGCTNFGNTQEVEWNVPSQLRVYGGALHIEARHLPTMGTAVTGAPKEYPYRSGIVTTYPSFRFTYGRVRVVARLPAGPDMWPALWLLPVSGDSLPEIDMYEGGADPTGGLVAFHPTGAAPSASEVHTADLTTGWHTFGLDWEPGYLSWSIDGKQLWLTQTHVPDVPMYLILCVAVNNFHQECMASTVPASCEGTMVVRSVQVWQR